MQMIFVFKLFKILKYLFRDDQMRFTKNWYNIDMHRFQIMIV